MLSTCRQLEFAITDFTKKKECNAEWISPVFYSHPDGYKLCLVMYPNGISVGKGTHISIYVGFLSEIHVSKENWHAVDCRTFMFMCLIGGRMRAIMKVCFRLMV